MSKITFITKSGQTHELEATTGSLMELATRHKVAGIDAECGGVCSCATCHIQVDEAYWGKLNPASQIETDLLEFYAEDIPFSRLACQIPVSQNIDGMVVKVVNP
ncbi:MAG: 2Fe-2S iron-sulfur cluster-binding protein [Bacteroidota bacterium]